MHPKFWLIWKLPEGLVSVLPDLECCHDQRQSLKTGKQHVRADVLQADARGARDQKNFNRS